MTYRNPNPGDVGASTELLVASNLLDLGFEVFRSVSPTSSFDLVAVDSEKNLFRVEVKTSKNVYSLGTYKSKKADIFASIKWGEIEYRKIPTAEVLYGKGGRWYVEIGKAVGKNNSSSDTGATSSSEAEGGGEGLSERFGMDARYTPAVKLEDGRLITLSEIEGTRQRLKINNSVNGRLNTDGYTHAVVRVLYEPIGRVIMQLDREEFQKRRERNGK